MEDTAQPLAAETPLHEQLANAQARLGANRQVQATIQDRDPATGRFTGGEEPEPEEQEAEADLAEAELPEGEEYDETQDYEGEEAPEEDQPEAVEMPKSWSKEDEETWRALPPAAQAKIAEREGQRDAAINSKFQEVANARKEYEAKLEEANASRNKWAQDYDTFVSDLSLPKPDPHQFGYGTGNFDHAGYNAAQIEWEQGSQHLESLKKQREEIRAQQEKEALESWNATKAEIEAQHAPKLLALKPELKDPTKAETAIREVVNYAIENGMRPELFSEENQQYITSAELAMIEKARLYDSLSAKGAQPAPRKKQPQLRPGVATPPAARKSVQVKKAEQRLQNENSIEAAAMLLAARRK